MGPSSYNLGSHISDVLTRIFPQEANCLGQNLFCSWWANVLLAAIAGNGMESMDSDRGVGIGDHRYQFRKRRFVNEAVEEPDAARSNGGVVAA